MSSVEWSGDEFLADVQTAIEDGLERAGLVLVQETRRLLNLRGSSKSAGGQPSPPGEPPANMTGNLFNSIIHDVVGSERSVYVGVASDSPANKYALIHEFGGRTEWAMMPARPYLRPALAKVKPDIDRAFGAQFKQYLEQKGWL
jgi:phage gpG-like protein